MRIQDLFKGIFLKGNFRLNDFLYYTSLKVYISRFTLPRLKIRDSSNIYFNKDFKPGQSNPGQVFPGGQGRTLHQPVEKIDKINFPNHMAAILQRVISINLPFIGFPPILGNSVSRFHGKALQVGFDTQPVPSPLHAILHLGKSNWIVESACLPHSVTISGGGVIDVDTVITREVLSLCVAARNPFGIIRRYDEESLDWSRI